nr:MULTISPECIES: class C sortase [Corynebacterium]
MATTTVERTPRQEPAQKSFFQRVGLPVILILVGLAVLMYPVVATQWNNRVQQDVAERYEEQVQATPAEEKNQQIESARTFNAEHTDGPILDPWLARISKDNVEYREYLDQLSGAPAMSQVVIPSIDVKLPLYHGTSEETLQKGLGHLYGTSLPVGGEGTHSVITGHTGLTNATLFDDLIDVQPGDAIYVSTFGERMKYQVYGTEVVLPDEVQSLRSEPGKDLVTLITCTPYGINTHRLLVHAQRVSMDAAEAEVLDKSASTIQWWMWVLGGLSLVIFAGMALWIIREKRKDAQHTELDATAARRRQLARELNEELRRR